VRTVNASRCTLEPQVEAHASEMFAVLSDPAIYEFENEPPPSEEWLAKRYAKLETRVSQDGDEQWLNWVVRLPEGELAGYVQATVLQSGKAYVAYEFASRFWRQGIGSSAVEAMLNELETQYGVQEFMAVLNSTNYRSKALLRFLGFAQASSEQAAGAGAEPDETLMVKHGGIGANAA